MRLDQQTTSIIRKLVHEEAKLECQELATNMAMLISKLTQSYDRRLNDMANSVNRANVMVTVLARKLNEKGILGDEEFQAECEAEMKMIELALEAKQKELAEKQDAENLPKPEKKLVLHGA